MRYLVILSILATLSFGISAFIGDIEFKQDDGSKFKAKLKGDEWFSWIEDKKGNIIKYNKDKKRYEYAKVVQTGNGFNLVPSGISVTSLDSNASIEAEIPKVDKKLLYEIWRNRRGEALSSGNGR